MKNFDETPIGLYPEDLFFDEKTQTFQKRDGNFSAFTNHHDEESKSGKQDDMLSGNGLFQRGIMSKLFEGNELLSTLLASGGLKNSAQKNNFIMQALSNLSNKKQTKESKKSSKEKTQEIIFEEL